MENETRLLQQQRVRELMKRARHGPYVEHNPQGYIISIEGRGEELLYQENGRGVLVFIIPFASYVDGSSIKYWDDLADVSILEKELIMQRIISYFKIYQKMHVVVG